MSESAVASEGHFETPPPAEIEATEELSLREIIERASRGEEIPASDGADKATPQRDANGRFASTRTEEGGTEEEVSTDQPAPEAEEPEPPAIQPPQAWSASEKELFAKAPREVQDIILRREADVAKGFQERAPALREHQAIQEVLAPHAAAWRAQGYTDVDAIRMWATVAGELKRDPETAIRELARVHGVNLGQPTSQDTSQPAPAPDQALMRKIQELEGRLEQRERTEQESRSQAIVSNIEKFASDPKHPHFEAVRVHMGALMQAGVAADMETAYEMAVHANPETRAKVIAERQAAEQAKRAQEAKMAAEKARKAAVTVRGSPPVGNGAPVQTGASSSVRDDILASMRSLGANV